MGYSLCLVVFSSLEIGKREKANPQNVVGLRLDFYAGSTSFGHFSYFTYNQRCRHSDDYNNYWRRDCFNGSSAWYFVKAKILRRLHNRSGRSIFPIHIPIFRRGKREAEALPVDDLTDQELEYILALLDNAPTYSV